MAITEWLIYSWLWVSSWIDSAFAPDVENRARLLRVITSAQHVEVKRMGDKLLTQDELRELVDHLDTSRVEDNDAMLLASLLTCYPTKVGQNQ